jgi:hypothetical protein
MLELASPAAAKMRAGGRDAIGARRFDRDNFPALARDARPHALTRQSVGEIERTMLAARDSVPARPDFADLEFHIDRRGARGRAPGRAVFESFG